MQKAIDFYFDFTSPYGYLGSTRIDALAAKHKREVVWHPILLGVIFKTTSTQPLMSVPLKGDYSKRDMARSARLYGVPFRLPSRFPVPTQAPARAFYWIADHHRHKAQAFAQAVFAAYFVDDIDISNPESTLKLAQGLEIESEQLAAALADAAIKERLKTEVDQAMARGVFGSPFFIVEDEPFWGCDRMQQLDRWLETGGW